MRFLLTVLILAAYLFLTLFVNVFVGARAVYIYVKLAFAHILAFIGVLTLIRQGEVASSLCPVHYKTVEEVTVEYAKKTNNRFWRVSKLLVWRKLEKLVTQGFAERGGQRRLIFLGPLFYGYISPVYKLKALPDKREVGHESRATPPLIFQPQTVMSRAFSIRIFLYPIFS